MSYAHSPMYYGLQVRNFVVSSELTVTEAARVLGIGHPALSNFLNGKAKLSSQMALRLERAFGADRQ